MDMWTFLTQAVFHTARRPDRLQVARRGHLGTERYKPKHFAGKSRVPAISFEFTPFPLSLCCSVMFKVKLTYLKKKKTRCNCHPVCAISAVGAPCLIFPPLFRTPLGEAQMYLKHNTPSSGGIPHAPPRVFENELSPDEIRSEEGMLRECAESGTPVAEVHKSLRNRTGKRVGDKGKQQVIYCCAVGASHSLLKNLPTICRV